MLRSTSWKRRMLSAGRGSIDDIVKLVAAEQQRAEEARRAVLRRTDSCEQARTVVHARALLAGEGHVRPFASWCQPHNGEHLEGANLLVARKAFIRHRGTRPW